MLPSFPFFLLSAVPPPSAGATLLDESLAKFPAEVAARTHFSFVVLGDSRYWEPVAQTNTFRAILRSAALLRGAFAVDTGDLILGYTFDPDLLNREWDEFEAVVRGAEVPLIPVVG